VTEPYLYDGQLIVEQSHPIVIDGKFRGIGAVDRALSTIEGDLRARASDFGVSAYLVSSRGRFIVATEDAPMGAPRTDGAANPLRTTLVSESRHAAMFEQLAKEEVDADGIATTATDQRTGAGLMVAAVRIEPGGWLLVLTRPLDEVMAPIHAQVRLVLLTIGAAAIGALILVVLIVAPTGKRLDSAAGTAEEIARGNLAAEVMPCAKRDEAGVLLNSLESMRASLERIIAGVQSAGVTVDTSAVELSAASREQAAMAQRFGASTAQVAAASRQISVTGRELARTMEAVEKSVEETAELAGSSRSGLAAVDGSIRELAQAADSIAVKLSAISERAAAINAVVAVIAKVADQTNLLSVNAAIEAEKAGEQGRGFLVVAREIRRLADQTAGATVDIEAIVREMQSAVGAGVMEMDRFAEKVRRGVEEVTVSSRRMGEVIERVGSNAERYRSVADGMGSQSQGAESISQSMAELADAASRASRSAEEFGRTAAELERASQTLRGSVGQFTLRRASNATPPAPR
ncbi:MAG: methyl-accepting chemotaxis protein, partial [Planctomycetota bacterium]